VYQGRGPGSLEERVKRLEVENEDLRCEPRHAMLRMDRLLAKRGHNGRDQPPREKPVQVPPKTLPNRVRRFCRDRPAVRAVRCSWESWGAANGPR
jgi:hypothetical protein